MSPSRAQERWSAASATAASSTTQQQSGKPLGDSNVQESSTAATQLPESQAEDHPRLELSMKLAGLHW